MSFTPVRRLVNPRLGPYFAIFASAYVALILLALIADQLGAPQAATRWAVLLVPLVLYAVIGMASYTTSSLEFFAAGRRVPAVYSGFTLAFSALGGTGLVAMTGTLFLVGFDALCIVIGGLAGFVVMGILLAPFFRKFGAYTIPSYLGRRFESPALRLISGAVVLVPLVLMLAAEIKMASFASAFLTGETEARLALLISAAMILTLVPGGTRALTWSSVAQTIAALLALIIPVAIIAVMWTNLPLPQLSHGPLLRLIGRQEAMQGLPIVIAQGFAFDLPGHGVQALVKRYAASFGAVGPAGFVAATLTIMMGVAACPWLLPRIATAPGVYHARKSLGWATLLFGIVMLTATSVAVFSRAILFESTAAGAIPDWIRQLAAMGFADTSLKPQPGLADQSRTILSSIGISRDAVLFALPMAAGLSQIFTALAINGAIVACLAGASAAATALAATLGEDLVHGLQAEPPPDTVRLTTARTMLVVAIAAGGGAAAMIPGDPLDMLLWSLALTGSAFFPVLVLSIWWKRISAFGAVAGITSGFSVAVLAIAFGEFDWLPFDPSLAGMFGIPASVLATLTASLATPHPGRHALELVRDIRVPGGEILYDREMRLLRLKKRQRTSDPV
jgi:cation/acetate symporter